MVKCNCSEGDEKTCRTARRRNGFVNKTSVETKNMVEDFLAFAKSKGRKAIKVGPSSVAVTTYDDGCLVVRFSGPSYSMQSLERMTCARIRNKIERYSEWQRSANRRAHDAEKRASELTGLIQELKKEIEG